MNCIALLVLCGVLGGSQAQMAGTNKEEEHPTVAFSTCTESGGCMTNAETMVTMDSQWRWLHDAQSSNCIKSNKWAVDAATCGTTCSMEGISKSDYQTTYGINEVAGGLKLSYVNGQSVGSRLYMMEDEGAYKMFKLLNREFSLDVDVSSLDCGLNGAVYFVEMEANGGLGTGTNQAGAKYGTGYCDAQCPHDLKFIGGQCNIKGWHMTPTGPMGHYGSCCSEMDIWEANALSTAYTAHPCTTLGPKQCEGDGEPNICGDTPEDCKCCSTPESCPCCGRYKGVCDRDGCDYNSYRLGNTSFFGKGPQFVVDASRPMTVVTQFITSDGTDSGDLTEIRRLYVQDGKVIKNSAATNVGTAKADSITDDFCKAQKQAFGNTDDFSKKGGLKAMGQSLKRGMVLVLSLWDDALTKMDWLDSATPASKPVTTPGVKRGPCSTSAGNPPELRAQHPDASVTYSNIRVGEIGSTYGAAAQPAVQAVAATASIPATLPAQVAPGMVSPAAVAPSMTAGAGPLTPGALAPASTAVAGAPWVAVPGTVMAPGVMPVQGPPSMPANVAPSATQVPGIGFPAAPAANVMQTPGLGVPAATAASSVQTPSMGVPATPAVGGAASARSSGPVCCTSAKGADKCGSCWPGSALSKGFCASEASCAGCGGQWCSQGAVFAAAFEEHKEGPVSEVVAGQLPSAVSLTEWALATLVLTGVVGAVWVRIGKRRVTAGTGEREALCDEMAMPEAAA